MVFSAGSISSLSCRCRMTVVISSDVFPHSAFFVQQDLHNILLTDMGGIKLNQPLHRSGRNSEKLSQSFTEEILPFFPILVYEEPVFWTSAVAKFKIRTIPAFLCESVSLHNLEIRLRSVGKKV